ncbi:MAG TPA: hypothetical protein VN903_28725 [Polyangia bacterium]|nr:hypothetical protein [Polyangia bacterium]
MNVTIPPAVEHITSASKRAAYKPANRFAGFLLWPLWPLLDPHTGRPSKVQVMAWAIYIAFVTGHPIATVVCGLLLAAVLSNSALKDALAKWSFSATASDAINLAVKRETSHATIEMIQRTYNENGEPAHSNPPVANAMTAAGES